VQGEKTSQAAMKILPRGLIKDSHGKRFVAVSPMIVAVSAVGRPVQSTSLCSADQL
jgi:hypothetical protein